MNYTIITDENKLKEFIEWLPELKDGETYYYSLFARRKYTDVVFPRGDKAQLKRGTSTKERLLQKIKQLELKVGTYEQHGVEIPQEALALYITVNPRSLIKATKNTLKRFVDLITQEYTGYNPQSEVLSQIQKAKGTTHYVDFDFDLSDRKEQKVIQDVIFRMFINRSAVTVLQTRGGFHLLVDPTKVEDTYSKTWYVNIKGYDFCDVAGDNMIPVPGTSQGGYTPTFI